jgi:hypothetical protein
MPTSPHRVPCGLRICVPSGPYKTHAPPFRPDFRRQNRVANFLAPSMPHRPRDIRRPGTVFLKAVRGSWLDGRSDRRPRRLVLHYGTACSRVRVAFSGGRGRSRLKENINATICSQLIDDVPGSTVSGSLSGGGGRGLPRSGILVPLRLSGGSGGRAVAKIRAGECSV